MSLYQKKYRAESARLVGRDYAGGGKYYVTICTLNRACWLGEIIGIEMKLSPLGEIVADEWRRTAELRSNVELDASQIMPNHLHGILILNHPPIPKEISLPGAANNGARPPYPAAEGMKPSSLGSIIGQFKGACTKRICALGHAKFDWQPRFYDHIVRNEKSLESIRQYIHDNPRKWAEDSDNPVNWMDICGEVRKQRIEYSNINVPVGDVPAERLYKNPGS